jgi:hypothetical protein
MKTVAVAFVGCLSLFAGCSPQTAAHSPAASASQITSGESKKSASAASPVTCFNPHGGECLGPLEPGTYQTSLFTPAFRYTVPQGWVNAEDLTGNFWLYRLVDSQQGSAGGSYVSVYSGIRASSTSDDCPEEAQPDVGTSPEDLVAWFQSRLGLRVTRPNQVEVGGLDGLVVDITLRRGYRGMCPWSEGQPVGPLIIGSGISQLYHVVLRGLTVRLIFLRWGETNVTIEITSVHEQLAPWRYFALTAPIVESLKFDGGRWQEHRSLSGLFGQGPEF